MLRFKLFQTHSNHISQEEEILLKHFKVDEYVVREKGRDHSVLVFPFVKYMWVFNDWPGEDCYMVDGSAEAFSKLKYALAILIEASDKIIYFPCKQEGIGTFYNENYNLVLCTPKAQLHRSSWIAIRRKLNTFTKRGRYRLQYNRKKLDDFCMKRLFVNRDESRIVASYKKDYFLRTEVWKQIHKEHLEKLMGENLFLVLGKLECYFSHYCIAEDLDELNSGEKIGTWSALGWIQSPSDISRLQKCLDTD